MMTLALNNPKRLICHRIKKLKHNDFFHHISYVNAYSSFRYAGLKFLTIMKQTSDLSDDCNNNYRKLKINSKQFLK